MDVDLRKLRYFLAVAETSNFRRAAEQLHISQPALTRQIRVFEAEIQAELFVRSSGGTRLTAAGCELRDEAEALLAASAAVLKRVGRATHPAARIIVGFAGGLTIHPLINEFTKLNPDCDIELHATLPSNQSRLLMNGTVDVCLGRLPIKGSEIAVVPIFSEPRVIAVGREHRLATTKSIGITQLQQENVIQPPDQFPAWWPLSSTDARDARLPAGWGEARTIEDRLENVAAGNGIVIMPTAAARMYPHPGVVYKQLDGVPPATVALAYMAGRVSPLLTNFADLAHARLGNSVDGTVYSRSVEEIVA